MSTQLLLLAIVPKSKFNPEQDYRYARMGSIGRQAQIFSLNIALNRWNARAAGAVFG
jgi:hypothetical protein